MRLALGALLLWAVVTSVYHAAPRNGFHFDDYPNIVLHAPVHVREPGLWVLIEAGRGAFLPQRPLPSVTFAWDWRRGGGAPAAFQRTNVGVHALAAVAVLALLLTVVGAGRARADLRVYACALLAAAIWAAHPIQVQGVTYIVQRMASLAAMFTLVAVTCFVQGRRARRARAAWFTSAAVAFACGVLCKETAWITPFLVLLAEYGICRHDEPLIRDRIDYVLLGLPLVVAAWVIIDLWTGAGPLAHRFLPGYELRRDFTLGQRLLSQPRVIAFHLSQFFWPVSARFSIEHSFAVSTGLLTPVSTLACLVALLSWCGAGVGLLLSRARRVWGFCMLWLPATLVIESSFVPLEMVFEHRMYLPAVGLAGLGALALREATGRRGPAAVAAAVVAIGFLVFAGLATTQRVPDWRDEISLNRSALDNAPQSARLWANLGYYRIEAGQAEQGLNDALHALSLQSDYPLALKTAGLAMMRLNRLAEAEQYFYRAYELAGATEHNLLSFYGELLYRQGRIDEALQVYETLAKFEPQNPAAHWNLARTHEARHECDAALSHWRSFLALTADAVRRTQVMTHIARTFDAPGGSCFPAR